MESTATNFGTEIMRYSFWLVPLTPMQVTLLRFYSASETAPQCLLQSEIRLLMPKTHLVSDQQRYRSFRRRDQNSQSRSLLRHSELKCRRGHLTRYQCLLQ